jgi:hypothetical protein
VAKDRRKLQQPKPEISFGSINSARRNQIRIRFGVAERLLKKKRSRNKDWLHKRYRPRGEGRSSDQYLKGLWGKDLATELLWASRYMESPPAHLLRSKSLPSWSWASCCLPVSWNDSITPGSSVTGLVQKSKMSADGILHLTGILRRLPASDCTVHHNPQGTAIN